MLYRSSQAVKRAIGAHSLLGLSTAVLLYVLCFSGALAVFLSEFERWQQPQIKPFETLSAEAVQNAYQQLLSKQQTPAETLWVIYPDPSNNGRAHVSDGNNEWFIDPQGNLLTAVKSPFADMLLELHYYLHIPKTAGLIVVGILGVLFMALVLSGILSHASIIKDAFKLRLKKSESLKQTDLHNRIGAWGLPFVLMITFTGAFIGVANVIIFVAANMYYEGDTHAVVDAIYGQDPVINTPYPHFDIAAATQALSRRAPHAKPLYIAFQKPGTAQQFLEIAAMLPNRLVFSEIYRFDPAGHFINAQQLASGPAGRQIAYSVYRLHFGHYGHYAIKFVYAAMGFAIAVLIVSGVNIWLSKRRFQDPINRYWPALVWGLPLAFCCTATLSFWSSFSSALVPMFWLSWLIATLVLGSCFTTPYRQRYYPVITAAALIAVVATQYGHHGLTQLDSSAHWFNAVLVIIACVLIGPFYRSGHAT